MAPSSIFVLMNSELRTDFEPFTDHSQAENLPDIAHGLLFKYVDSDISTMSGRCLFVFFLWTFFSAFHFSV